MKPLYQERAYAFRSRGLFDFLRILHDAHPEWVDLAGIRNHLPGIDPRQLARFVDLLETAGLPLVRHKTKTRGPFRLAVAPESIAFPGDQESRVALRPAAPAPFVPIAATPLVVYQDDAWVAWDLEPGIRLQSIELGRRQQALDRAGCRAAAIVREITTLKVCNQQSPEPRPMPLKP